MKDYLNYLRFIVSLILVSLMLSACSGGSGSAGTAVSSGGSGGGATGSGGSGSTAPVSNTVSGTITGFGSIVVDGQEYAESASTSYASESKGTQHALAAAELNLGQHVNLTLDSSGNIVKAVVIPDLEGPVSSITSTVTVGTGSTAATLPAITVSGVLVVTNSDPTQGPVTAFGGGYTALTSVALADNVEVHGILKSANGVDYVQATHIAKEPTFIGTRVIGTIANYNASANTFTLGSGSSAITINATGATVEPASTTLANGLVVSVWSSAAISNNSLTVTTVRVANPAFGATSFVGVSGPISAYVSQSSFVVNGLTVDASGVTLPSDVTALSNGLVVGVAGTINSSGTLVASKLHIFESDSVKAEPVFLQGSISNFVSAANFTVRGVQVDGSQNPTFSTGSTAANLVNGAFVRIKGTLTNNTVVATKIDFITPPANAVVNLIGQIQSYDATTNTVTITAKDFDKNQVVTAVLSSSVMYLNGTAANLTVGQLVDMIGIESTTAANTFNVNTVTFLPTPPSTWQGGSNGPSILLNGTISAVTPATGTVTSFVLHGLTINVGSASILSVTGATNTTLAVGEKVSAFVTVANGNVLTASVIQIY